MSDRETEVHQFYKDDLERRVAIKEAYFARGFEISRQRIVFFDRLTLLAAGTLTVSFTAATSFQSKSASATLLRGTQFTEEAVLLAISIVCSLAFSWLTLSNLIHSNRLTTTDSSMANRQFGSTQAKAMMIAWEHERTSMDLVIHEKAIMWGKITNILTTIFAITSLASFIASYVLFFMFVHANLFRHT
jgi:hypothetical protein